MSTKGEIIHDTRNRKEKPNTFDSRSHITKSLTKFRSTIASTIFSIVGYVTESSHRQWESTSGSYNFLENHVRFTNAIEQAQKI